MIILYRNADNELKEEKAVRIIPSVFYAFVTFEDGREEQIKLEKIYNIYVE